MSKEGLEELLQNLLKIISIAGVTDVKPKTLIAISLLSEPLTS